MDDLNLPDGWEVRKLGSLAEIKTGKSNSCNAIEKGIYPFFDRSMKIKWSNKYLFDARAIIIPGEGKEFLPRYFEGKFDLHQRAYTIFNFSYKVIPKYIYYYLLNNRDYFSKIAVGSTVKSLRLRHFTEMDILLPPLPEQEKITEILASFDDQIENLTEQNKTLEEIAKTIFKRWFIDFEFPNEEGKPYKSSGGEMTYNEELGKEIPRGWEVEKLGGGKSTKIVRSGIKNFDGFKKYIATANVDKGYITGFDKLITYDERPSRANMQPKINTVWFAKMANSVKHLIFYEGNKHWIDKYILSTGFAGLECNSNLIYYLYEFIKYPSFWETKDNLANGAVQVAINNNSIKLINILIPPEVILNGFNRIIKPLYDMIFKNIDEIQTLTKIRDTLLPKLITGKIRVKV